MVDRAEFDEWLRERAAARGARCASPAQFERIDARPNGLPLVHFAPKDAAVEAHPLTGRARHRRRRRDCRGRAAGSAGRRNDGKFVFAYHEIVETPSTGRGRPTTAARSIIAARCSPDFYAWIFPHGETMSVGTGSAHKGFSLQDSVRALRARDWLERVETIRHEGAPIPLKPLKRWDNGRDVVLAGDAAGVVAPASGEGIYYAMLGGRLAADAAEACLATGDARALRHARKRFMKEHGRVFWILGVMQYFWYANDKRREHFVSMCRDNDVQRLTWESYMNKNLPRRDPLAHVKSSSRISRISCRLVPP